MRPSLRGIIAPLVVLSVIALVAGAAGYATSGPPRGTRSPAPDQPPPTVRGVVQSIAGDQLSLMTSSGPLAIRLPQGAPVERLRRAGLSEIVPGDWLNGGAVGHAQTIFALIGIVVIPQSQLGQAPK